MKSFINHVGITRTQPVPDDVLVEVILRDGTKSIGIAKHYNWRCAFCDNDVTKYRIIQTSEKEKQ